LYEANLLPSRVYSYKALRLVNGNVVDSAILTVSTLDTTSHNFTWTIDTLGDGNNSSIRDVAIINDTCVWTVGEIYKRDSTGQFDTQLYGAAVWDGTKWNLMKVPTQMYGGSIGFYPLMTVYGFSNNDIWTFSAAGSYSHWNGTSWNTSYVAERSGGGTKFWGTASTNLYLVGTNGSISHYNGSSWQKMDSPTDVDLTDVWGSPDGSVVWACGYYSDKAGTFLLRCINGIWEIAYDGTASRSVMRIDSLSGPYTTLYTPNTKRIYVGSTYGIYRAKSDTRGAATRYSFTTKAFPGFPFRLRGNDENDIVIVGEYSMIAHFNGYNFKYYSYLSGDARLTSLDQKGNFIVTVGFTYDSINSKGLVFIGRR
jgi:hypothetical protein